MIDIFELLLQLFFEWFECADAAGGISSSLWFCAIGRRALILWADRWNARAHGGRARNYIHTRARYDDRRRAARRPRALDAHTKQLLMLCSIHIQDVGGTCVQGDHSRKLLALHITVGSMCRDFSSFPKKRAVYKWRQKPQNIDSVGCNRESCQNDDRQGWSSYISQLTTDSFRQFDDLGTGGGGSTV